MDHSLESRYGNLSVSRETVNPRECLPRHVSTLKNMISEERVPFDSRKIVLGLYDVIRLGTPSLE